MVFMMKYKIAVVVIILIGIGGYYFMSKPAAPMPQDPEPVMQQPVTQTYSTSTYSVVYPADYSVNEMYAYDQFGPTKLIHGVKFAIPMSIATGTNLSATDTGVSVEQLPRAVKCTGDIYLKADVKAVTMTDGAVEYSVATSTGAAAGNQYEEQVFALPNSSPCTAVRYFIHTTSIGNYGEGTVREFDRASLIADFDQIRRSLSLGAAPATTPTSASSTQP